MTRGKRWDLVCVAAAALSVAACGAGQHEALDSAEQIEIPPARAVSVHLILRAEHAAQSSRYWSAARTALTAYADRFGALPFTALNLVDPGWPPSPVLSTDASTVAASTRLFAPGSTMGPEIAVTRAIGGAFWRHAMSCGGDGSAWIDGLTRFTATPVIASQFAVKQISPAYAFVEQRYFGGLIPLVTRVPLQNATMGNGLDDYLLAPGVDPRRVRSEIERRAAAAKTALALGTLEHLVGAPTWDAVLAEFASQRWTRCPSPDDLEAVASRVTGVNLSWFFTQAFDSSSVFDYGVERLTTEPVGPDASLYRTTVVVRRYGDAIFAGSSAPRVGPFESGRGIELRVAFVGGSERTDYWDGRDGAKSFVYESPSPVRSAVVDPRYVLLLDANRTNNSRTLEPAGPRAATRWGARWAIWLEDLLLTYASLV